MSFQELLDPGRQLFLMFAEMSSKTHDESAAERVDHLYDWNLPGAIIDRSWKAPISFGGIPSSTGIGLAWVKWSRSDSRALVNRGLENDTNWIPGWAVRHSTSDTAACWPVWLFLIVASASSFRISNPEYDNSVLAK
jgi:hypothetical protein